MSKLLLTIALVAGALGSVAYVAGRQIAEMGGWEWATSVGPTTAMQHGSGTPIR